MDRRVRAHPPAFSSLFAAVLAILAALLAEGAVAATHLAQVIRVGPTQPVKRIADAARLAKDGDTVEIDAGDYVADVAVWDRANLTIRGLGGMARIAAGGASVEGKGTWVIRGGRIVIENVAFSGSRVSDGNGAGIRFERGSLHLINCVFTDNQNGILTGHDPDSELEIERSEFGNNGGGDGYTHNLYVGAIRRLKVTGSYFHHANVGHLLKSRAQENYVMYNRLTDETGGRASYELEFPSGGLAYVVGNIIQQGPNTQNPSIISFGAEGYRWPRNELYLVNNTIANDRSEGGSFLHVAPGAHRVRAINNLLLGKGSLEETQPGEYAANFHAAQADLAAAADQDYRIKLTSRLLGKAIDPGQANGVNLRPGHEYVHARQSRPTQARGLGSPGALQSVPP